MSEQDWDDGIDAPPQQRGIPGWLWFCGGGCLLAIVIGIGAAVWGLNAAKKWIDPEEQWPRLAEVLPFDERPSHLTMKMSLHFLVDIYVLSDDRGYGVHVWDLDASKAPEFRRAFEEGFSGDSSPFGGVQDPEATQIEIQGREHQAVRFYSSGAGQGPDGGVQMGAGEAIAVDLTPEGHPGFVPVFIVRTTRQGDEPLSDEEIRDVLSGFRIGPDYAPPPPEPEAPTAEEQTAEEPPAEETGGAGDDGQ